MILIFFCLKNVKIDREKTNFKNRFWRKTCYISVISYWNICWVMFFAVNTDSVLFYIAMVYRLSSTYVLIVPESVGFNSVPNDSVQLTGGIL